MRTLLWAAIIYVGFPGYSDAGVLDSIVRGATRSTTNNALKYVDKYKTEDEINNKQYIVCTQSALSSSVIQRAELCSKQKSILYMNLLFTNGSEYRYFDVPQRTYEELVKAPSAGRFFNAEIKNRYRCQRLGESLPASASRGCN